MPTLNRNNSNWSAEERRKINENWDILESLGNSTASGNNGLKQDVEQIKITVSESNARSKNALQKANEAIVATANSLEVTANAINATTNAINATTDAKNATTYAINSAANAVASSQAANNAAQRAETIATNIEGYDRSIVPFSINTTFLKHQHARFNGSTYQAKVETTGNPLPLSPATENEWWTLTAQRGVDGNGAVASVDGILPDSNGNVQLPTREELTKLVSHQFKVPATANGQTQITIPLGGFNKSDDTLILFRNMTTLLPDSYTVNGNVITLAEPVVDALNTTFHMLILRTVLTDDVSSFVQEKLDSISLRVDRVENLLDYVNYKMFGAALDGVTDDTIPILAAHQFANDNKIKVVQRNSKFVLNGQVTVRYGMDLAGSECYTSLKDVPNQVNRTANLYTILGTKPTVNITSSVNKSEFLKGVQKIPSLANLEGVLNISSRSLDLYRSDGVAYYKRESNIILKNPDGELQYPMLRDYTDSESFNVALYPFESEQTIYLPKFILNGAELQSCVLARRNNTTYVGGDLEFTNYSLTKTEVVQVINVQNCGMVTVDGLRVPIVAQKEKYGDDQGYGYVAITINAAKVKFKNIQSVFGWSGITIYDSRDIGIEDSILKNFTTHQNGFDIYVKNCKLFKSVQLHGGGMAVIEDCTFYSDTFDTAVSLRNDFGSEWDGVININRCVFKNSRWLFAMNAVNYQHGRKLLAPHVNITNCNFLNESNLEGCRLFYYAGQSIEIEADVPTVNISNVEFKTRGNKECRVVMFSPTGNWVNSLVSGKMIVNVSNVRVDTLESAANIDYSTYDMPKIPNENVYFEYNISDCNAVFLSTRALGNSNINVFKSEFYSLIASNPNAVTTLGVPSELDIRDCTIQFGRCNLNSNADLVNNLRVKLQNNILTSRFFVIDNSKPTLLGGVTTSLIPYIVLSKLNYRDVLNVSVSTSAVNPERLFDYLNPAYYTQS